LYNKDKIIVTNLETTNDINIGKNINIAGNTNIIGNVNIKGNTIVSGTTITEGDLQTQNINIKGDLLVNNSEFQVIDTISDKIGGWSKSVISKWNPDYQWRNQTTPIGKILQEYFSRKLKDKPINTLHIARILKKDSSDLDWIIMFRAVKVSDNKFILYVIGENWNEPRATYDFI
jgi:NDP-sugar pyrophosphorylase family protein